MAPASLRPSAALAFALGLAALVVLFDQLTKWLILGVVMAPPRIIEVTGFFNLVLVFNTGVSFGLFGGEAAWKPYAFGLLALAVSGGLLVWLWRSPQRLLAVAVGLVIGGALGNVIDRLRFAAVVDFLDFHLGGWHWPAFNLADAAITLGVALLVVDGLFLEGRRGKKA